jgi:hypothetical protein
MGINEGPPAPTLINEDPPAPSVISNLRGRSKSLVKEKAPKPKRRSTVCSRPFLNLVSTTPQVALSSSSVKRSLLAQKSASADTVSAAHTLRQVAYSDSRLFVLFVSRNRTSRWTETFLLHLSTKSPRIHHQSFESGSAPEMCSCPSPAHPQAEYQLAKKI